MEAGANFEWIAREYLRPFHARLVRTIEQANRGRRISTVDPHHTAFTMLGMTTSYFAAAPSMSKIAGRDLLTPQAAGGAKEGAARFSGPWIDHKGAMASMTGRKFLRFSRWSFSIALTFYLFTTPRGSDIPLTGIVDGNEVIVSPQITGRIVKLTVDEGSAVKKGDLIAELDPQELASESRRRQGERHKPRIAGERRESQLFLDERSDRRRYSIRRKRGSLRATRNSNRRMRELRAISRIWTACRSCTTRAKFPRRTAITPKRP